MSVVRFCSVNPWPRGSPEVREVLVDDLAAGEVASLGVGADLLGVRRDGQRAEDLVERAALGVEDVAPVTLRAAARSP